MCRKKAESSPVRIALWERSGSGLLIEVDSNPLNGLVIIGSPAFWRRSVLHQQRHGCLPNKRRRAATTDARRLGEIHCANNFTSAHHASQLGTKGNGALMTIMTG